MLDKNPTWPGWEIAGSLGEGSYGEVFEIHRVEGNNVFKAALKVIRIPNGHEVQTLRDDGMDDQSIHTYLESIVNGIRDEYALMAKVRGCPNIVYYDDHMIYEDEDGLGWTILIKMELLKPFKDYVKDVGLTEALVKKTGIELCKALEACQEQQILHRDIKPDNMFVSDYDDIKLGDFGIARTLESTSTMMTRIGTYPYMSPEVYHGERVDFTADIYSVGMILYRLLNDNIGPFEPSTKDRTIKSKQEAESKRLAGWKLPDPRYGSREIKDIILCATQYNPEKRFRNPKAMRVALEQVVASESPLEGMILDYHKNNTEDFDDEKRQREEEERRRQEEERRRREEEERRRREEEERRRREEEKRRKQEEEKRKKTIFRVISGLAAVLVISFGIFIAVFWSSISHEPQPEPDPTRDNFREGEDKDEPQLLVDSSVMLLGDTMTVRFYNGENTYAYDSNLNFFSEPNTVQVSADNSRYRNYIIATSPGWTTVTGKMDGIELSKDIFVIDERKATNNILCDTQEIVFQVTETGSGAANFNLEVEGWSGGELEARFYTNAGSEFKGDVWVTAQAEWKKNKLKATVKNYLSSEKNGELVIVITEKGKPESLVGVCRIPVEVG